MEKAVRCDECSTLFEIELVEDPDGLQWFHCTHCGRVYEVARISIKGREIRAKLTKLRRQYEDAVGRDALKMYGKIKQLQRQLKREVKKLS